MLPTLLKKRQDNESPMVSFPRDIDKMFSDMMSAWRDRDWADTDTAAYPCDIREEDGQILVDAELPGFKADEVSVTLDQGVLNICAEHKQEKKKGKEGGRSFLQERQYRRIERAFTLPATVDESKVDADLKDGVLHLTLLKAQQSKPREIKVK